MMTIDGLIRDLMALNRVARSGSPSRLRITWKNTPTARTLAGIAQRTDRAHQRHQAPPARRVATILEQLAKKAESK